MCFFFSLLPASMVAAIAYIVLFSPTRAEGAFRKSGQVLGVWLFLVTLFFPVWGVIDLVRRLPDGKDDAGMGNIGPPVGLTATDFQGQAR